MDIGGEGREGVVVVVVVGGEEGGRRMALVSGREAVVLGMVV